MASRLSNRTYPLWLLLICLNPLLVMGGMLQDAARMGVLIVWTNCMSILVVSYYCVMVLYHLYLVTMTFNVCGGNVKKNLTNKKSEIWGKTPGFDSCTCTVVFVGTWFLYPDLWHLKKIRLSMIILYSLEGNNMIFL